jgi:hypothetical protein
LVDRAGLGSRLFGGEYSVRVRLTSDCAFEGNNPERTPSGLDRKRGSLGPGEDGSSSSELGVGLIRRPTRLRGAEERAGGKGRKGIDRRGAVETGAGKYRARLYNRYSDKLLVEQEE